MRHIIKLGASKRRHLFPLLFDLLVCMPNDELHQYAAEKTYNNQLPKQGEVIAPFVVTWEQVQYEQMDTRNLKTWTLRGGRKVLVAFTTVEAEKFNDMMRIFNFMADGHVRVDDKMNNLSLDKMQENPTAKYKESAGISSAEEDYFAFIEMTELINEGAEKDAESGAILTLLASGMEKSEILQKLPYAKSQGYEKIKAAQRIAREVRDRCL